MTIGKISDKAAKISDSFTVNMYDNGFMVELWGEDENGNGVTVKILANSLGRLIELVSEAAELPRRS